MVEDEEVVTFAQFCEYVRSHLQQRSVQNSEGSAVKNKHQVQLLTTSDEDIQQLRNEMISKLVQYCNKKQLTEVNCMIVCMCVCM